MRNNKGHYPKIRIYLLRRHYSAQERFWEYQGSTTHYPTTDAALRAYLKSNRIPDSMVACAKPAATHGYHIEVE